MTSNRKRTSNRNNAQKSTGPRSKLGRQKSSRNALRYGLAVAIGSDPAFSHDIETLAIAIEHAATGQAVGEFARQVAEAELDILRIRKIKASLFVSVADNPDSRSEAYVELNSNLAKLERYERRALSRRKRALRAINSCGRPIATKQTPSDNHD